MSDRGRSQAVPEPVAPRIGPLDAAGTGVILHLMKRTTARIIREIERLEPEEREEVARAAMDLTVPWPSYEPSGKAYAAEVSRRAAEVMKPGYKGIPAERVLAGIRRGLQRKQRP